MAIISPGCNGSKYNYILTAVIMGWCWGAMIMVMGIMCALMGERTQPEVHCFRHSLPHQVP